MQYLVLFWRSRDLLNQNTNDRGNEKLKFSTFCVDDLKVCKESDNLLIFKALHILQKVRLLLVFLLISLRIQTL